MCYGSIAYMNIFDIVSESAFYHLSIAEIISGLHLFLELFECPGCKYVALFHPYFSLGLFV